MAETQLQVVVTDEALLKEITFNYDQLKTSLTRKLKKYNQEVSAESVKDAKEDRAELNALEKILAGKASEIQKKILGGFDVKIKELRGMIKEASGAIDVQVKALEQITKDKKRLEIEQLYAENIGELKDLLPLVNFFQGSWLNVTVTIKKVEAEMIAFIGKVKQDLIVIDSLKSEFELQIKDHYLQYFDISGALLEKERLEKTRIKIEAAKPMDKVAEVLISKEAMTKPEENIPWANASEKEKQFRLVITGSEKQFGFVKDFLGAQKIKFMEVK